jgi:hypothetical protein
MNVPRHPNRSGIPYCPPPAVKPVDIGRHGQYETGKGTGETQSFQLPTVAFENVARVSIQPCWLMLMNIAFLETLAVPAYALVYDINGSSVEQLSLLVNGAIARWTLGPVPNGLGGGSIMWSPESEHIPDDTVTGDETSIGIPFNFGITVVLSSTPRRLTNILVAEVPVAGLAVTARFKV